MTNWICVTCGTQFDATATPPANCPICDDDRQYIGPDGQKWTTLPELKQTHHNRIELIQPGLIGIGSEPKFGIGQRALWVGTNAVRILWDPTLLLDDNVVQQLKDLGGIQAIAVSHPHLATTCVEWSKAFGASIFWHEDDKAWIMRTDPVYHFWTGESFSFGDGVTLIRCGGHFPGSAVLHVKDDAGNGILFAGDTVQVVQDRRYVSFMYSYPNLIPLNAPTVSHIVDALEPYAFDRIYGGWWDSIIPTDAKNAVRRSADRYIAHIK